MATDLLDVHGLLFKRQQYKEADLLAKLWTKELGIVTVIAKGGMRPFFFFFGASPEAAGGFGVIVRNDGQKPFTQE